MKNEIFLKQSFQITEKNTTRYYDIHDNNNDYAAKWSIHGLNLECTKIIGQFLGGKVEK